MAGRFLQGFAGGWAMVIGRAVIVDLATGAQLVRVLNVIAAVGGIAPIVGPLMGAVILQLSHWRVSFWVVAALGVAMIIAVLVAVPETLPAQQRHAGGLRTFVAAGHQVLRNRGYVGYVIVSGSAMGAVFSLASGAPDIAGADPVSVARGMRVTFAAAAVMIAAARALAAASQVERAPAPK